MPTELQIRSSTARSVWRHSLRPLGHCFQFRELRLRPHPSLRHPTSRHHNTLEYLQEHPTSLRPWRSTQRGVRTRSRCSADTAESRDTLRGNVRKVTTCGT